MQSKNKKLETGNSLYTIPAHFRFSHLEIEELYENIYNTELKQNEHYHTFQDYFMFHNFEIHDAQKVLEDLNVLFIDYLPNPRLHLDGFVSYGFTYEKNEHNDLVQIEITDFTLTEKGELLLDEIFQKYSVPQQQPFI